MPKLSPSAIAEAILSGRATPLRMVDHPDTVPILARNLRPGMTLASSKTPVRSVERRACSTRGTHVDGGCYDYSATVYVKADAFGLPKLSPA